MTRAEQKVNSIKKELEKLNASIDRNMKRLEKKTAAAEKVGANWTKAEWQEHRDARTVTDDQFEAYFEMTLVQGELEDLNSRKANAEKRLAKATGTFETETAKKAADEAEVKAIGRIENAWLKMTPEERKADYEAWLKRFKAECLKDGVEVVNADKWFVRGWTKSRKWFVTERNSGVTERSFHCYTLTIEGKTIFTSGDFTTCYRIIKR